MGETKKQILEILLLPYILRLAPNAHCRRPLGGLIVPLPNAVPTMRKEWGQEKEQKGAPIFYNWDLAKDFKQETTNKL